MNKALFAALASVALFGSSCSCSVKDFAPVVLDAPSVNASFGQSSSFVDLTSYAELASFDDFAYNYCDDSQFNPQTGSTPFIIKRVGSSLYVRTSNWNGLYFRAYLKAGVTYTFAVDLNVAAVNFAVTTTNDRSEGGYQGLSASADGSLRYGTFTPDTDKNYFRIWLNDNVDYVISDLRICEGSDVKRYFPYSYCKGYYDALTDYGIFNHAYYVQASDGSNTYTNYIDTSLLLWYASANTQGLFDPYSLVSFFGLSSSATSYTITIQYGEVYSVETFPLAAFPLYVDVLKGGEVEDSSLLPSLSISRYRGGSIRGYTLFDAEFSNSYAGLATGYPNPDVYNREYDTFNRISLYLPKNQSYSDMRQIGVVSPYARGYADGVTSRNGEVEDLTEQILNLQEDLSQYQGKDYQQIYNLGYQAGLDVENQGAKTFNSLFGNILSAPLTILNGVSDISFFGMPILTAILSLLMVAIALFLFKRFK